MGHAPAFRTYALYSCDVSEGSNVASLAAPANLRIGRVRRQRGGIDRRSPRVVAAIIHTFLAFFAFVLPALDPVFHFIVQVFSHPGLNADLDRLIHMTISHVDHGIADNVGGIQASRRTAAPDDFFRRAAGFFRWLDRT